MRAFVLVAAVLASACTITPMPQSSNLRLVERAFASDLSVPTTWIICDESNGNLLYVTTQALAVVPHGCAR